MDTTILIRAGSFVVLSKIWIAVKSIRARSFTYAVHKALESSAVKLELPGLDGLDVLIRFCHFVAKIDILSPKEGIA